jgi:hypothetical protein
MKKSTRLTAPSERIACALTGNSLFQLLNVVETILQGLWHFTSFLVAIIAL